MILEEIKDPEEKNIEVSKLDEPTESEIQKEDQVEILPEEVELADLDENLVEPAEDTEVLAEEVRDEPLMEEEIAQVSSEEIEYLDDYEDIEEVDNQAKEINNWILPVDGEILTEFALDKLVFSQTLEEWGAHTGLDIKANVGDKVKAPGNGIETRISNLGTMEMVEEGLEVKQGDIISTVGDTAAIEMSMVSHVHYEVFKNGKIIDPRSITN